MSDQEDSDELVRRLVLHKLRNEDCGWHDGYEPPWHFVTCLDITISAVDTELEMWFDTGVEATRIIATLNCPHMTPYEWEWADLGELPDILRELDELPERSPRSAQPG